MSQLIKLPLMILFLVICAAVWVLPVFVNIIWGSLPYLNAAGLMERFIYSLMLTFIFLICLYFGVERKKRKKTVTLLRNWKDIAGAALGFILFSYVAAMYAGNTLGVLVRFGQSSAYKAVFVIIESSRSKGYVELDLKDEVKGKIFNLVLSKRLFEYGEFRPQMRIEIVGRKNTFGIYVESYRTF